MDLIDIGLYLTAFLLIASIGILIILEALNLVKDPKALMFAGAVIVGLVVLFFISYSLSTGDIKTKYTALGVGEGSSRLIGAGLIMLYIFLFGSIIGMIASEIYKLFK
jgi:hypothetical protein